MKVERFSVDTTEAKLVKSPFGEAVLFEDHNEVLISLLGSIQQRDSKIEELQSGRGSIVFYADLVSGEAYPSSLGKRDESHVDLYLDPQGRTFVFPVDPNNLATSKTRQISVLTEKVADLESQLEVSAAAEG
jgi:hypothetical protein